MPPLSKEHMYILTRPTLISYWMVFDIPSMHSIFDKYFSKDILSDLGDIYINDPEIAIKQLHRQVLLLNNDDLFDDILSYCKDKCTSLSDLIETMWIDVVEDDEEEEEAAVDTPLSPNQFDLLLKKDTFFSKFETNVNRRKMTPLVKQYSAASSEETFVDVSADRLHRLMLKNDSQQFYNKVCKLLRNELDKFQICYNFMSKTNFDESDDDEKMATDSLEVTSNSHELLLLKSQMTEVKSAMGCIVREFTEEMFDLKLTITNIMNAIDGNVNTEIAKLQCELSESQSMVLELKDKIHKQKLEIANDSQQMKKQIEMLQSKMNELESEQTETRKVFSTVGSKVERVIEAFLFVKDHPEETKHFQQNYKDSISGLSPIFPNEFGIYPSISWRTLHPPYSLINWRDEWSVIVKQSPKGKLWLPPLILPVELGGWVIFLSIQWFNELKVYGRLAFLDINKTAPDKIDVHLKFKILIDRFSPFVFDKTIAISKSWGNLWTITDSTDINWPLPSAIIQVNKF